jgi:hypothetical protein
MAIFADVDIPLVLVTLVFLGAILYALFKIVESFYIGVIVPMIGWFSPKRAFIINLAYAKKGWFCYEGSTFSSTYINMPKGCVRYENGGTSKPLTLGTAVSYAQMFNGTVEAVS